MAMFLILLSLISVSVADLDAKGACALQTKHRLEEGAKKVSVACSADELVCYDSTGHTHRAAIQRVQVAQLRALLVSMFVTPQLIVTRAMATTGAQ